NSFTSLDWAGLADIGWSVDKLAVAAQPASITAGQQFTVKIAAVDPDGAVDTTYNGAISVVLGANPGGASLGGTPTQPAINGVATFGDLTLNKSGNGYTLLASSTGLPGTTVTGLNVKAAAADHLVVIGQPPSSVPAGNTFPLVVAAEDPL